MDALSTAFDMPSLTLFSIQTIFVTPSSNNLSRQQLSVTFRGSPFPYSIYKSNSSSTGWLVGLTACHRQLNQPNQQATTTAAATAAVTKARGNAALCINLCTHSWPMRFMRCVLLFLCLLPCCCCCCPSWDLLLLGDTHPHRRVSNQARANEWQVRKTRQRMECCTCFVRKQQRRRNNRDEPSATWRNTTRRHGTKRVKAEIALGFGSGFDSTGCDCQWSEATLARSSVRLETAPEVDVKRIVCRVACA